MTGFFKIGEMNFDAAKDSILDYWIYIRARCSLLVVKISFKVGITNLYFPFS